jgi:hypothetical protein
MKYVPFGISIFVLANILKAGWRPIVTVRNNHPILYDYGTNLLALAKGQFAPFTGHP